MNGITINWTQSLGFCSSLVTNMFVEHRSPFLFNKNKIFCQAEIFWIRNKLNFVITFINLICTKWFLIKVLNVYFEYKFDIGRWFHIENTFYPNTRHYLTKLKHWWIPSRFEVFGPVFVGNVLDTKKNNYLIGLTIRMNWKIWQIYINTNLIPESHLN